MTAAIVHVASGREWRGGQRQVWLLARGLAQRGVEQVVVTGRASELAGRLTQNQVRVHPVPWSAGLDPRVLSGVIAELRNRPALIHTHDAHALTLGGIGAALTGAPLVATRRVTFPLKRAGFWKRAHRVIAISPAVLDSLTDAGVPPDRIVVIPDAVDLSGIDPPSQHDVRSTLKLPLGGQLAVSLGALTPEKAHSTLIDAAAILVRELPRLHWVIVGEGPLRRSLERQVVDHGLSDRFHLIGELPDPHVALAGADLFVLSSAAEGLGSSVLAAMALGVPVVATAVGGVPGLVGQDRGLTVPPGRPEEFAAAVRRVFADRTLRNSLTRAALAEVRKFEVGAMAERVLEVYRSCGHSLDPS